MSRFERRVISNNVAPERFLWSTKNRFGKPLPQHNLELVGYAIRLYELYWESCTDLTYKNAVKILGREDLLLDVVEFGVFKVFEEDNVKYLFNEDLKNQFVYVRGKRKIRNANIGKVKYDSFYDDLMQCPYKKELRETCIEIAAERGFDITEDCVKEWFNKFMEGKKNPNWPFVFKDAMDDLKDLVGR
jgi:hypothetical protein